MSTSPEATTSKKLGHRIRALREALRMSQAEFAEMLDAQPSSVARWEQGKTQPNGKYFEKLFELANQTNLLRPLTGITLRDNYLAKVQDKLQAPATGILAFLDFEVRGEPGDFAKVLSHVCEQAGNVRRFTSIGAPEAVMHTRGLLLLTIPTFAALMELKIYLKNSDSVVAVTECMINTRAAVLADTIDEEFERLVERYGHPSPDSEPSDGRLSQAAG